MKRWYILFGILLLLILLVTVGRNQLRNVDRNTELTWENCIDLPDSVIQESYPERCIAKDGRSVTRPLTPEEQDRLNPPIASATADYYGSSTSAACTSDNDCIVSGCNSEICQGKDEEEGASICILPDKPLPKDVGLSCDCSSNKCQWVNKL